MKTIGTISQVSTTSLEAADVKAISDSVIAALKPLIPVASTPPTAAQIATAVAAAVAPLIPTVDQIADAVWKRALSPVVSPTDNAASWVRRAAVASEAIGDEISDKGIATQDLQTIVNAAVKAALGK